MLSLIAFPLTVLPVEVARTSWLTPLRCVDLVIGVSPYNVVGLITYLMRGEGDSTSLLGSKEPHFVPDDVVEFSSVRRKGIHIRDAILFRLRETRVFRVYSGQYAQQPHNNRNMIGVSRPSSSDGNVDDLICRLDQHFPVMTEIGSIIFFP